ncbi:MAG: hypothetical protein DWG76_02380 [Chloroflexi bacterium]|nr:hypothetical protein [Chloroflexota bacterium]
MAFTHTNSKGNKYILHERKRTTSTGKTTSLYFFAKEEKAGALDSVPSGYMVAETKTGLPVLKKG